MRGASVLFLFTLGACSSESTSSSDEAATVAARRGSTQVTRIRVNGESSDAILNDPTNGTNGFVNASRDQVANTSALDFSYVTPTSDPDIVTLVQGAGEIPNSAYTTTNTTAHLNVVTPFPVIRCDINLISGEYTCVDSDPIPFDLMWNQNGFSEVEEHIRRTEKIGPLTIKFNGGFHQRSALVNGFWNGDTAVDMSGNLLDTQNTTVIREITMTVQ